MPRSPTHRPAFTLAELFALIVIALAIAMLLLPFLTRRRTTHIRPIKDSTQVRGIHQGMILWAQNNKDVYPLPSALDVDNTTVADQGTAKDTTANIVSIMIFNGFFSPELCVSPSESNGAIKIFDKYQYSDPSTAAEADKSLALWDPAFPADFTGGKQGAFSYAHALPSGDRLPDWYNTFSATSPVLGNRGPQVASITQGKRAAASPPSAIANSNTLRIHGAPTTWEGNIVYNDNHVAYETSMMPPGITFKDSAATTWSDCVFFDEPNDPTGRNAFLGIFTSAGDNPAAFKSIWD